MLAYFDPRPLGTPTSDFVSDCSSHRLTGLELAVFEETLGRTARCAGASFKCNGVG